MGFLLSLLAPRLGKVGAEFAIWGGLIGLLALGLVIFGHIKYRDGEKASDQKWEAASAALQLKATKSAAAADVGAMQRQATHDVQVAQEKEQIDEAEQNGSSPMDVLFGAAGNSVRR